jgi:hypothetical protein
MDRERMRERLVDFGNKVSAYTRSLDAAGSHGPTSDLFWPALWRDEPTVRQIFTVLDPALANEFNLNALAGDVEAQRLVQSALGILDDMDEWAVRLRPDAPALPADQFHPWVWDAAADLLGQQALPCCR